MGRWENVSLRINAQSGVSFFFDPVLGTANPRAFVRAGSTLTVAPDWIGGLRGDFATGPRPETAPRHDVTAYVVPPSRASCCRPICSASWAACGPTGAPPSAPDFAFHQPLRWVYLSLTGTTRAVGRWGE